MSRTERTKGLVGEREVRALYEAHGYEVRGLESGGDHLAVLHGLARLRTTEPWPEDARRSLTIHSEVKRTETARPWAWWEQASAETPSGSLTIVAFRRSRSPWLALASLDALAGALAR
jgi:hypothetical protein